VPAVETPRRTLVPLDPARVPRGVRAVLEALWAAGEQAHLVGGCVRDLLLGAAVRDFDVATSGRPEPVLALFPRAVPIGLRHGTVMVPTPDGPVDVTSWRAGERIEHEMLSYRQRIANEYGHREKMTRQRARGSVCSEQRIRTVHLPTSSLASDSLRQPSRAEDGLLRPE